MAPLRYRRGGERTDIDMADLASAMEAIRSAKQATSRREALRRFRGDPFRCH
jgi:uncharacterized protein YqgV (UPF0045/DUF77 family)